MVVRIPSNVRAWHRVSLKHPKYTRGAPRSSGKGILKTFDLRPFMIREISKNCQPCVPDSSKNSAPPNARFLL